MNAETEKRPTLSLKRKPTVESPSNDAPVIKHRKKTIIINTAPAKKIKQLAPTPAKKVDVSNMPVSKGKTKSATKPALKLPVTPAVKVAPKPPKKQKLISVEEAVLLMKPHWPGLFDGDTPRLMQVGITDVLFADMVRRELPLSRKQLRRCLKALTRSSLYRSRVTVGAARYDIDGNRVATISTEDCIEIKALWASRKVRVKQKAVESHSSSEPESTEDVVA